MLYKIRKLLFGSNLIRAIKNEDSLLHNILNWFSDKYTDLIIVPYETICRFLYWGWKLRKNYSFDCSHNTYYILYLKFKGLIDYSRKYGHLLWNTNENGKEFRRLKIACYLAKRLYEDDHSTHMNVHDKKWGENNMVFREDHRIIFWREKAWNPELKEKETKEWHIANKLDDQQKDNEREYFFHLLNKYIETWWD